MSTKAVPNRADPWAEALLNRDLQSHVDQVLSAGSTGSELTAQIAEAHRLSGAHLSKDEESSFLRLRNGLAAQGRLSPEAGAEIDQRISHERALRALWIQAAYESANRNAQVAGTIGVVLAAVLGIGLGASEVPSDAAGLYASGLTTSMLFSLILGRGLPAIGESNAERYGVNKFEAKQEKKLSRLGAALDVP